MCYLHQSRLAIFIYPLEYKKIYYFQYFETSKTWIQNKTGYEMISGLCLMSVHLNLIKSSQGEFVKKSIDLFAMENRRIQFLFK